MFKIAEKAHRSSNPGWNPGSVPSSNPGSNPISDHGLNPGLNPGSKFRYPPAVCILFFSIHVIRIIIIIKVGTGTSPCNKSREQVLSHELAIFATRSSHRD